MNMAIGCSANGKSQPKEPVRPVDANGILRSIDMDGCAYDGSEYQAYKAGAEYVRGLIEDAPTINPETQRPIGTCLVTKTDVCGMYKYKCSSCGALRFSEIALHLNYCSNCGKRIVNADD